MSSRNVEPPLDYRIVAEALRDNPGQWKAYESNGHCVVLAGPGSGKTKVLTTKIARMLAEDVRSPRGIACITYSNECAREIKKRLATIGVFGRKTVFTGTVHGFCLKHLVFPFAKVAGEKLPFPISVAAPAEQSKLFQSALARVVSRDEHPSSWRTRMDKYRKSHLDRNSSEWRHNTQLAQLIEEYERLLRQDGKLDFDDMVIIGLRLVENHAWVRKVLQAQFPILVIDEYQDLGTPLHRLATCLMDHADMRLFAVGDPDQSVYGFQGACPELLLELADRPNVQNVPLRFNYRCGASIILAAQGGLGEERDYLSKSEHQGTVDIHEHPEGFAAQMEQAFCTIIPESLVRKPGRRIGDIAVIYPDRHVGAEVEKAAKEHGYSTIRIDQGASYQKTPMIRWLEECAQWCSGGWRTGTPALADILQQWSFFNPTTTSPEQRRRLQQKLVRFLFANRSDDGLPLRTWLGNFGIEVFLATLKNETVLANEKEAVKKLYEATASGKPLERMTAPEFGGQQGSPDNVNLITLHSAKGLEFDVVIMPGLEQGKLPWMNDREGQLREKRRLFYVGMTRARHEVHLLYSGWYERYGQQKKGPSVFVTDVIARMERQ